MNKLNNNSGFTLIEVLIALLIIAVGLLSIAALQLQGVKYNHEAYLRSQINLLAYDMADLMRLNQANADSYLLNNYTVPTSLPGGCTISTASNAANELACWQQQIFNALPPGSTVNITKNGNYYTVSLAWFNRDGGPQQNIDYTFQP